MRFPLSSVPPAVRPAAAHDSAAIDLWRRWTLATTIGELLGFAVPALAGAAVFLALGGPDGLATALAFAALLTLAGAGEGAVLGTAQARVLVRAIPALSRRAWVIATALAAALAWSIGMLPSTVIGRWEIPPLLIGAAAVVLVPVLLGSIGAAQWLVLRRSLPGAALWIPANAIAWIAGLPFTVVPPMLLPNSSPVAAFVTVGIAGGVLMGATVGAITAWRSSGCCGQRRTYTDIRRTHAMIGDLDRHEIDRLLRAEQIGRLGVTGDGRVYIFPVSYGYDGEAIYLISHPGLKVRLMRAHPEVCFEVEQIESPAHWRTVMAHGQFEELTEEADRDHAIAAIVAQGKIASPPSMAPYVDGPEAVVVYRIHTTSITGRFERDDVLRHATSSG